MKTNETAKKTGENVLQLRVVTARSATWEDIRDMENLPIGSELEIVLKDGSTVVFQLAANDVYGGHKAFVSKDCVLDEAPMNHEWTNDGGWGESDMRNRTMKKLLELLPDELREIIVPRQIRQNIHDKKVGSEDLIWIPSYTEAVGPNGWGARADVDDVHFPLFDSERARVKQDRAGKETTWWWLRSPNTGSTTAFYFITTSGSSINASANYSCGVAFGFLI